MVTFSADMSSCAWMYSSMSCMPVTSGAPSHTTRSASLSWSPSLNVPSTSLIVASEVMSPWMVSTPSIGAISCRSTATILTSPAEAALLRRRRERTCDHEPGAAHRSTARVTLAKRSNSSSSCSSLYAERARQPSSLAFL